MNLHLAPSDVAPIASATTRDWATIESGLVITNPIRLRANEPIPAFVDDVWGLGAMGKSVSATRPRVVWVAQKVSDRGFPPAFSDPCKRVMYLMINEPTPLAGLAAPKQSRVEWPSSSSLVAAAASWRTFTWWLHHLGVTAFTDCNDDMFEMYQKFLDARDVREGTKAALAQRLIAISQLADALPDKDRLPSPPWTHVAPAFQQEREPVNRTPAIPSDTFTPLLKWAALFVTVLADDILAALRHRAHLIDAHPYSDGITLAGVQRAQEILSQYNPIPGRSKGGKSHFGEYGVAARYLIAMHGGCNPQDFPIARRDFPEVKVSASAPQPIDVPISGTIEGQRWCEYIDWRELDALGKALQTASLIICATFSGARPNELLGLPRNCVTQDEYEDLSVDYFLHGHITKRVRDKDGQHSLKGKPHVWATLKIGADAADVASQLGAEGAKLLFAQPNGDPITTDYAVRAIDELITIANRLQTRIDLPAKYKISMDDDEHGNERNITLSRFRRTVAWHIRNQPNGEAALGIQFGHLSNRQGFGYGSTRDRARDELTDTETVNSIIDTMNRIREDVSQGAGLYGPAADRLIIALNKFNGILVSERELRKILADPDLQVHNNPTAIGVCVFNRLSACRSDNDPDAGTPDTLQCKDWCANLAFTDNNLTEMHRLADDLRQEAAASPQPLADRLVADAEYLDRRASRLHTQPSAVAATGSQETRRHD